MKRTVPLLITALGGFVLIVAQFLPETQSWGETAAVWFDILASIAFVLGGGNLLKMHLKKISDRAAGWGYSAITILAFLLTLFVGLGKIGSPPSPDLEFYGETFARLPLSAFPESQVARVDGTIPERGDGAELPASVRQQISQDGDEITFRGWMRGNQKADLLGYKDELAWQCTVERLFDAAQPPEPLGGQVAYYADFTALSFKGVLGEEQRAALQEMSEDPVWAAAVEYIDEQSHRVTDLIVQTVPDDFEIPASLDGSLQYDPETDELEMTGPMSIGQRDQLAAQFPLVKPLDADARDQFRDQLEAAGNELTKPQAEEFDKAIAGIWSVEQLRVLLNEAGKPQTVDKTACEVLAEKEDGVAVILPTKTVGEAVSLNDEQSQALEAFADDPDETVDQLVEALQETGTLTGAQKGALRGFFARVQTAGDFERALFLSLLRTGPLSQAQRDLLLDDYREQFAWEQEVGELFVAAHVVKHPWSGDYAAQGSPFWWLYEYAFKPLTATMFAMLAFYVASAAFRAFRAKNLEATLLLGTAFIILLGRTFAGVYLTEWLPDSLSGLRIDNLTVYIMTVFNTAGNRAILIGIALGIASTSLKVLLGVDRSYLGSSED